MTTNVQTPAIKLPWHKRASTWMNVLSGVAGVVMTQVGAFGLPPETAGYVQLTCSLIVMAAQVYNQAQPKTKA